MHTFCNTDIEFSMGYKGANYHPQCLTLLCDNIQYDLFYITARPYFFSLSFLFTIITRPQCLTPLGDNAP